MPMSRRHVLGATLGLAAAAAAGTIRAQDATAGRPAAAAAQGNGGPRSVRTPDGLNLSVRTYGDPAAPEILFIHGLGQSRLSWDKQIASGLADRFRLVTYDLRGHGDSDKPATVDAYSDGDLWADDLHAVIGATGLRRPLLVGWSLGGLVIGRYLARHGAQRVSGVNLVTAVTKLSPDLLGPTAVEFAPLLASPDLAVRVAAAADFLAACFAIPPTEAELRRMLVFNGMVPRELHEGVVRISNDGLDEAFSLPSRMLITYGAKDPLTRLEMSERVLAFNPGARLSVYRDSGHSPFYEEPDRFNRELEAFAAA